MRLGVPRVPATAFLTPGAYPIIAMHDLYDRLENRTHAARETSLLRDLAHVLTVSRARAPALRAQLRGLDAGLRSRGDLARFPIRRHADLLVAQAELGPFGGFVATRTAALAQVFAAPAALLSPAGPAKDWWGMGRALYAAGLRRGALVLNALAYDLVPDGHMVEAAARAIGCPVIPAGAAALADVVPVVERLAPSFFCGAPEALKRLLDQGAARSVARASLVGLLKPGLRAELALRGIAVHRSFVLPELGAVGYESAAADELVLAEHYLLEIVDPDGGAPVPAGEEGEVVISRVNLDYPLLRYGTGLMSRVLPGPSPCGRTNTRFAMPRPLRRADAHIDEIRRRHPDLTMRLYVSRASGALKLKVEHGGDEPLLRERLGETLRTVTRRRGSVEIVTPGSLPDEDAPPRHGRS